ncbi:MAG: hypothetical protein HY686_02065 [Chloroflexi bacterium]|nr:hypothetical protein [Chloroflexota bacterium]
MLDMHGSGRQRWSAMWNGIVIGLGIGMLPTRALPVGLIIVALGVGLEWWQRRRMRR